MSFYVRPLTICLTFCFWRFDFGNGVCTLGNRLSVFKSHSCWIIVILKSCQGLCRIDCTNYLLILLLANCAERNLVARVIGCCSFAGHFVTLPTIREQVVFFVFLGKKPNGVFALCHDRRSFVVVVQKVIGSNTSRMVWPRVTKLYTDIHTDLLYSPTGYDITNCFQLEVIQKNNFSRIV